VRRALMGSVLALVVWHAHCPVLAVRTQDEWIASMPLVRGTRTVAAVAGNLIPQIASVGYSAR